MALFSAQVSTRFTSLSTLAMVGSSLMVGLPTLLFPQSEALTAQEIPSQTSTLTETIDISFRQPNTGETGDPLDRPRGGGGRCGDENMPCVEGLTALVPFPEGITLNGQEPSSPLAWGQTLEAHPTLWFYLPYGADVIRSTEFELWLEDGVGLPEQSPQRIFHTTEIPLSDTSSITGYTLPESVTLEVGKTYRWNLLVQFDLLSERVSGRIQRVSLPSYQHQQLETGTLSEQAQLLANSGIWYDLLSTMVTAYPQDRTVWQTVWQDVLTDVGLPDIAAISLADAWVVSLDEE